MVAEVKSKVLQLSRDYILFLFYPSCVIQDSTNSARVGRLKVGHLPYIRVTRFVASTPTVEEVARGQS